MIFSVSFVGYYATTPDVGYVVLNGDGTTYQARSTVGVTVDPSVAIAQTAWVNFNVDPVVTLPANCVLVWDDGLSPANYAYQVYNQGSGGQSIVVIVNDNLPCG